MRKRGEPGVTITTDGSDGTAEWDSGLDIVPTKESKLRSELEAAIGLAALEQFKRGPVENSAGS